MVRWIVASCRKYFDSNRGDVPLFYENTGPKRMLDSSGKPLKSYAEFRIDGPYYRRLSAYETYYDIDLNVLCHTGIDTLYSDEIERMLGIFAVAFTEAIPVYKYGRDVMGVDDSSRVGCLIRLDGKNEAVRVSRFGQANPDTPLAQASVDGTYRMKMIGE